MASDPITAWEIDGETVETMSDFIFLGSKITGDGDYNHEIKRCLLLGRKVMTNLDSIFKSRDITLPTEVRLVKAVYCHPAYLTYMQSTSCKMPGWMNHKLELRLPGEISTISDGRKQRGTKKPLDESEGGE